MVINRIEEPSPNTKGGVELLVPIRASVAEKPRASADEGTVRARDRSDPNLMGKQRREEREVIESERDV